MLLVCFGESADPYRGVVWIHRGMLMDLTNRDEVLGVGNVK